MAEEALSRVRELVKRRNRYPLEAYLFIFDALDFTLRRIGERRHVSGQELCCGIRDLAIDKFGPLAQVVMSQWQVSETADFGNMVFDLIGADLMGKTEDDNSEDFARVYDLGEAFAPERALNRVFKRSQPEPVVNA